MSDLEGEQFYQDEDEFEREMERDDKESVEWKPQEDYQLPRVNTHDFKKKKKDKKEKKKKKKKSESRSRSASYEESS